MTGDPRTQQGTMPHDPTPQATFTLDSTISRVNQSLKFAGVLVEVETISTARLFHASVALIRSRKGPLQNPDQYEYVQAGLTHVAKFTNSSTKKTVEN